VRVEFSGDELILTLVGLIRAIDPSLLRHSSEGIQIDFATIERKEHPNEDERLLLRLRGALEAAAQEESYGLELSLPDRQRLAEVLGKLNSLQKWPDDVMTMNSGLQERLLAGA
jgi:hypothetical protein